MIHITTNTALLQGLREFGNDAVWREFDARFRRVIIGFGQRLGLTPDESAEVAQQTLAEFARDFQSGHYNRERGRLSAWILGIARHRVIDVQRARDRRQGARGSSAIIALPAEEELTRTWFEEHEQAIFDRALAEIRQETRTEQRTIHVFEQVALQGAAPREVAERNGLSIDQVYRIKHRVTERLRQIVSRIQRENDDA